MNPLRTCCRALRAHAPSWPGETHPGRPERFRRPALQNRLLVLALLLFSLACAASLPGRDAGRTPAPEDQPTVESTVYLPLVSSTPSTWWQPAPGTTWQWQLSGDLDASFDVEMYDVDMFDTPKSDVADLHSQGRVVICYISAGSWEDWRPDADDFPESVLGKKYYGWPGERWLDIRQIDLLAPIMRARLDKCAQKGFDGVEPDNIDGYTNNTGFPLTYQDQLAYNQWFANEAHARGLSIGLKNDDEQVADLLAYFDWAMVEDCFDQGWCEEMSPFIDAGKAVFAAEYTDTGITLDDFCPDAALLNFSAILKRRSLNAWRQACP